MGPGLPCEGVVGIGETFWLNGPVCGVWGTDEFESWCEEDAVRSLIGVGAFGIAGVATGMCGEAII
jgi:hypothetical protein